MAGVFGISGRSDSLLMSGASAGMLQVTMSPPARVLAAQFAKFSLDIRSFREPLNRAVRQVVIPGIHMNFEAGGRPSWPEHSEATQERYPDHPILQVTGQLRGRATALARWKFNRTEAFVAGGIEHHFGQAHDTGTGGMPHREFMNIQDEDEVKIEQIFLDWLEERALAAGIV